MEELSIKYHYQVVKSNNEKHKIILESFDNRNFELTILDNDSFNSIYTATFNNIKDNKELTNNVQNNLNQFYKK